MVVSRPSANSASGGPSSTWTSSSGQTVMPAVRFSPPLEDGGAADQVRRGQAEVGEVPAGAVVPPGRVGRFQRRGADVAGAAGGEVDEVEAGFEDPGLTIGARPGEDGEHLSVRPRGYFVDVPVTEVAERTDGRRSAGRAARAGRAGSGVPDAGRTAGLSGR